MDSKHLDCIDIYSSVMDYRINCLKWSVENSVRSFKRDKELFYYADSGFYDYRYTVSLVEQNDRIMLIDVLYKLMKRYGISFVPLDDPADESSSKNEPFAIIENSNGIRIGYKFVDFQFQEDVNAILKRYNIDTAYIIKPWRSELSKEDIASINKVYLLKRYKLRVITLEEFFNTHFDSEEYASFLTYLNKYLSDCSNIIGYKSIRFLSPMHLASRKAQAERTLREMDYCNYEYQVIDSNNVKIRSYISPSKPKLPVQVIKKMRENYIKQGLYQAMVGSNEYAESFISSEWLFISLEKKPGFDYTSVISGYLKSIEQLLRSVVMLYVDNRCRIAIRKDRDTRNEVREKNIRTYPHGDYIYIDFTTDHLKYVNDQIGTYEYFFKYNPHILINQEIAKTIIAMIGCFRAECRNGYFHTHNLNDWTIVEQIRSNAIYLYCVILGGCIIPENKKKDLGITSKDSFDKLCIAIREAAHDCTEYIFEYDDGRKNKLIYDFFDNTIEYNEKGIEHFETLVFHEVNDFSSKTYEALDVEMGEKQYFYLSRKNMPQKVFIVKRNKIQGEIRF